MMPLLAFLGPPVCVCRVVTAFFMLAFLIFPAAAETPPMSGSNGLMGLWGANSSAPQTGSSGKPISSSNEQQGVTAPGTPTESSPPSADANDAELESSPSSAPPYVAPPPIPGSNGLMGEWGANRSEPEKGSSGKPIDGLNDQQDPIAPGISTGSSPPSADAQLKSSPPDGELESSPPNVAPSPSALAGSNGLIEWSANGLEPGYSGKPTRGSNDQEGTTAPGIITESSPPNADAQDTELKSSPPDGELKSTPPSAPRSVAPLPNAQSGSSGLIEWNANSSESQSGLSGQPSGSNEQQGTTAPGAPTESSPLSVDAQDAELDSSPSSEPQKVAPLPSGQSGSERSMGDAGTTGSAAQPGAEAPNGQYANLESDIVAPETELSPSSAPPEQSLEATTPPASRVLVTIDKPTQTMKVFVDDVELYSWKVSSGLPGYATPSGAYTASSMNEIWYSKEWDDAPMPHAIFFTKQGHAIHGTEETKKLGRPASHGCVRLAPEDARTLFALVKEMGLENTEIVLIGDTPGGESRVAKTGSRKQKMNRAKTRVYAAPPRRFGRKERFQRRFSGRPRGFYWR